MYCRLISENKIDGTAMRALSLLIKASLRKWMNEKRDRTSEKQLQNDSYLAELP